MVRYFQARRLLLVSLVIAAVALAGCGGDSGGGGTGGGGATSGAGKDSGTVAFLLPENVTARWEQQDRPGFIDAMQKYAPGVKVQVSNALNDPAKQQAQAEAALAAGAKVLVLIPVDAEAAAVIVKKAEQQKVPVIAYDRLVRNSALAYYVSVDGRTIGELQGKWLADKTKQGDNLAVINGSPTDDNARLFNEGYMSVLDPLFASGERSKVYEASTPGWEPPKAQREMEQALTKTDNNIDGVLSANDGMAGGIIAALDAQKLAGKVPVTGLDATTEALQLILRGKQGMSVWRSLREQSDKAAQLVAALISGKQAPAGLVTGSVNNGQMDVPWATVTPQVIDATNIQLVIDDGAATKEQVCAGIPAGTGPC